MFSHCYVLRYDQKPIWRFARSKAKRSIAVSKTTGVISFLCSGAIAASEEFVLDIQID